MIIFNYFLARQHVRTYSATCLHALLTCIRYFYVCCIYLMHTFFVFFVSERAPVCAYAFQVGYIRSRNSLLRRIHFSIFPILQFREDMSHPTVFNTSISDSECVKAAQDVEKLDAELDELARELAKYDSSCSSVAEPAKSYRHEDFESLTAWLNSFSESLPSSQTSLPNGFTNLLEKPIEIIDESTMTSEGFHLACGKPSFVNISSSSSDSSSKPTTIASTATTESISSKPISISSASCTTPTRPPPTASTAAPKADRKPYTRKTGVRQYSRWSMSHLTDEYLARFKPMSQKRTLDRQFMIDALTNLDAQEKKKTEKKRPVGLSWD